MIDVRNVDLHMHTTVSDGTDQPEEIILQDENMDNPAAVLWNRVISQISVNKPDNGFQKPSNVIEVALCADSGMLPTGWCERDVRGNQTKTILLASEDVPTDYCSLHVERSLCLTDGTLHLANSACEEEGEIYKYGLLNYNRQFPIAGIVVADQQYCVFFGQRDHFHYLHSQQDIMAKYGSRIKMNERMPEVLSTAMGNQMYTALLPTKEDMDEFVRYVGEKEEDKPDGKEGIDYEGAYEHEECHQAD